MKIKFYSKKCISVTKVMKCDRCKKMASNMWLFEETNMGKVHICHSCKYKVTKTPRFIKIISTPIETKKRGH